jgi:hypothetical protein
MSGVEASATKSIDEFVASGVARSSQHFFAIAFVPFDVATCIPSV